MSFPSRFAHLIWDSIYTVSIPDQLSLDPEYVKIFGLHMTGDKAADDCLKNNFTTVMIPPIKMVEYFERGLEIRFPNRDDMIKIHKDIENYLSEWKEHLRYDINSSVDEHKQLILALERFSKSIHKKAKNADLIDTLATKKRIGLVNPLTEIKERNNPAARPDYEGIGALVKSKTNKPLNRF